MSRSLVGSSRSSTLGSVSSSRSSWKRRRSPPERSPSRAVSRSPVKPNRSSIELAVISPSAVLVTRRIDSTLSSTRAAGSSSSMCWLRCCRATVRPCRTFPTVGASSPDSRPSTEVLPAPFTPDQTDAVAGAEPPRRVREQGPLAALQVDVLDVDDVLAEPLGGEPLELEPVAHRRDVLDQPVGGVDAELRLGRPRRRPPAEPGELLADEVLAALLGGRRLALALRLGQDVRRVAALVDVDHAVVDLPRPLADRVEEPAVVGDHHERGGTPREVVGQPRDRLDVEVVGRLVEHDQVVVAEQQLGQRAAAPLAAGQPGHRAVEGDAGQQHLDHLAGPRVGGPLVVGAAAEHRLAHRVGVLELVGLAEVADQQPALLRDPAGVRLLDAHHHVEQRGLAVAVAPDHADPVARADAEGHVGQQRADAVRLGDPLEVEQVGAAVSHRSPRGSRRRGRG